MNPTVSRLQQGNPLRLSVIKDLGYEGLLQLSFCSAEQKPDFRY